MSFYAGLYFCIGSNLNRITIEIIKQIILIVAQSRDIPKQAK